MGAGTIANNSRQAVGGERHVRLGISVADSAKEIHGRGIRVSNEDLWDSIAADVDAYPLTDAQKAELDRRLAEHEADPDSAIPWQEVRERLYKKYG